MSYSPEPRHRWAVVLAGGDGTRLRELTRRVFGDIRPKQFCSFFGGKSLLAHTRERIESLFDRERTLFALSRDHAAFFEEELGNVPAECRIVQPSNRGTAVAMALCLRAIIRRDEDAIVAFFPSDHHYSDCGAFQRTLESALSLVPDYPNSILLLGAEARSPEVEYGWIQPGRTLVELPGASLRRVARFWEKPSRQRAEQLQQRGCLWNTFVTAGLASAFLELLFATVPELMRSLEQIPVGEPLDALYADLASVDFSKSVLAPMTQRLTVLRDQSSGWTDLGSPGRVGELLGMRTVATALP